MGTAVVRTDAADPRTRGYELGATSPVGRVWDTYKAIFAENGVTHLAHDVAEASFDRVQDWAPDLAEEMLGIAEGSGLLPWNIAALNARSEILAHAVTRLPGECSTAVFLPSSGAPRTIQTWDWHEALADLTVAWQLRSSSGATVKTLTECGIVGKIGVSRAGLGVHFNLLRHGSDSGDPGVPVHVLARRVLDEAVDVDSAEAIIGSAPVSSSVALTVIAFDGRRATGACFEVAPTGVSRMDANPDGFLRHTNHFIDTSLSQGRRPSPLEPDSRARLIRLAAKAPELTSEDLRARTAAMLSHTSDGAAICRHPGRPDDPSQRWRTLVTISLDLERSQLRYRDGNLCDTTADDWLEI
ncbi:peptidase C45 [Nocardioides eburneiflavus]|uniref:Peptidase C45 n=1 Tax=Nocardioides eburneiflavus TaxID=2518372 RepID=A0A4Z1CLD7_9ACTN|nr:C45 family peptidase [Nocardioides eburneiflavus]TGN65760.1 peptidase C45 [Nocardioides eburneiflavus]